jgi:hypothetical protein
VTGRLGAVSGSSNWRHGLRSKPIAAALAPGPTDDSATGPTRAPVSLSRRRLCPKSGPLNSLAPGPLNSLAARPLNSLAPGPLDSLAPSTLVVSDTVRVCIFIHPAARNLLRLGWSVFILARVYVIIFGRTSLLRSALSCKCVQH